MKPDKIPWIDKYSLHDKYKILGNKLTKLMTTLKENCGQPLDTKDLQKYVASLEMRFNRIKQKHNKLRKHFKNHRMSLLFYVCRFLSCRKKKDENSICF